MRSLKFFNFLFVSISLLFCSGLNAKVKVNYLKGDVKWKVEEQGKWKQIKKSTEINENFWIETGKDSLIKLSSNLFILSVKSESLVRIGLREKEGGNFLFFSIDKGSFIYEKNFKNENIQPVILAIGSNEIQIHGNIFISEYEVDEDYVKIFSPEEELIIEIKNDNIKQTLKMGEISKIDSNGSLEIIGKLTDEELKNIKEKFNEDLFDEEGQFYEPDIDDIPLPLDDCIDVCPI